MRTMNIGVAGTDRQQEEDWIMDELNNREHDAVFITPQDVSYVLRDGELDIRYQGESLNDLDVLFIRRTRFDLSASRDLVAAMDTLGIRTIERKHTFYNPLSKFYSLLYFVGEQLDDTNVTTAATGIVRDEDDLAHVADRVGFPLIIKPIEGREGEGIEKATSMDDLETLVDDHDFPILLQEHLDIEEEYRILVVGDTALGTVTKAMEGDPDVATGTDVARNYAQGAEFTPVDRPDLEQAAVRIANILGIELAGVDIAETTDGTYYELECNRCPQFKGFVDAYPDIDVAGKIVDYIEEQVE